MRIEYRAGERSTLDVLIAEETLRDAALTRLGAIHDSDVAQALLLRYIGRLGARDLVAAMPAYDPAGHFRKVEHKCALPWEALLRLLDDATISGAHQHAIPSPDAADVVSIPLPVIDMPAKLIGRIPVEPIPGTVGNTPVPHYPEP